MSLHGKAVAELTAAERMELHTECVRGHYEVVLRPTANGGLDQYVQIKGERESSWPKP